MLQLINQLAIQSPILALKPTLAILYMRPSIQIELNVDLISSLTRKINFICSGSVDIIVQSSNGYLAISVEKKATMIDVEEALRG